MENNARPAVRRTLCPACESDLLIARHCKSICTRCGYIESCEDDFIPNQQNPGTAGALA